MARIHIVCFEPPTTNAITKSGPFLLEALKAFVCHDFFGQRMKTKITVTTGRPQHTFITIPSKYVGVMFRYHQCYIFGTNTN